MKRVLSVLLVCVVFMTLVACAPKESEIDKLQQNITQLQQQLQQQLEQLESSGALVQQQLTDLQKEKELLQKKLDNLTGEPIVFRAEAPVYGDKERARTWASFRNFYVEGGIEEEPGYYYYDQDNYNPFEELRNCYIDEISPVIENEIFMLDPNDGALGFNVESNRYKEYHILVEGDGSAVINPTIKQHIVFKDEVLGCGERDGRVGMYLFFEPVYLNNPFLERTLEFGDNATGFGKRITYFNIYINQTCIGTCYYGANSYISAKWFTDYFNNKNNARLYYGGTMV